MKKYEKQIDALNRELEGSETGRKKLAEELALAVEGGKADKEELMNKIERLLSDISSVQTSEAELRESLGETETKLEHSAKEVARLQAALQDEKEKLASLKSSSSSSSNDLMEKLAQRETEIERLQERRENLEKELQDRDMRISKQEDQLQKAKRELEASRGEAEELKKE